VKAKHLSPDLKHSLERTETPELLKMFGLSRSVDWFVEANVSEKSAVIIFRAERLPSPQSNNPEHHQNLHRREHFKISHTEFSFLSFFLQTVSGDDKMNVYSDGSATQKFVSYLYVISFKKYLPWLDYISTLVF
jgi:hypothetical protein